jgi:hypothetical protein
VTSILDTIYRWIDWLLCLAEHSGAPLLSMVRGQRWHLLRRHQLVLSLCRRKSPRPTTPTHELAAWPALTPVMLQLSSSNQSGRPCCDYYQTIGRAGHVAIIIKQLVGAARDALVMAQVALRQLQVEFTPPRVRVEKNPASTPSPRATRRKRSALPSS